MSSNDVFSIDNSGGVLHGCIDLVYSLDDGGWYAQQYDFKRKDNATRTSRRIFRSREALAMALQNGHHRWSKWS